jgi:hypothetical protein
VPLSLLQRCHLVLALVVAIGASGSFAACHEPRLTPPEAVRIDSSSVLIVTHASALYDSRYAIKHGLDQAVMWAKERRGIRSLLQGFLDFCRGHQLWSPRWGSGTEGQSSGDCRCDEKHQASG